MPIQSRLHIFLRHHQLQSAVDASNVVLVCVDGVAQYVPGNVPGSQWVDMTEYCEGVDKLQLSWDAQNNGSSSQAQTIPEGSNYDKGVSLDINFFGDAFTYIWDWLLTNPCQILNSIDVKITDTLCGKSLRLFEIKVDNLQYSPYDDCQFNVKLREQDLTWSCIHRTFIWDNWQHWFEDNSAKEHPCFITCIDPRPRILNSVRMGLHLFIRGIKSAAFFLGFLIDESDDDARHILGLDKFSDAPLVRDYISNVCDKCGVAIDTVFHDPESPYYNLCLYYPSNGAFHENNSSNTSPALWYHFDNRWNVTLDEFLDKLKLPFNAEWYITPNQTLLFYPESYFLNLAPIYDFTLPGAFSINLDLVYTFDGDKKPAYGRYQYSSDGSDLASQEISNLYNDIVDYDGVAINPMLEGDTTKNFDFAPTAFVRDGRSQDYIRLLINDGETIAYVLVAILTIVSATLLAGTLTATGAILIGSVLAITIGTIIVKSNHYRSIFSDADTYSGTVRVTAEQVMIQRLLLWDGVSKQSAKVVSTTSPAPNTFYNPTNAGYTAKNNIGVDNAGSKIYNYPMYVDSEFQGNLYDRFHDEIDNPLKSLETHQSFEFTTDLCCAAQDVFGLWEDDFPKIGYIIKIEERAQYSVFGRIKHIDLDYETNTIKLKGKVIKR
jgi:hypothetical protein